MPRYSVIIPAYNAASYLPRVLEPLRDLGSDWEVLVIDDGSSDSTSDILPHYSVRALQTGGRQGQSRARNQAAQEAVGEILVFVDSDVVTTSDTLRNMVAVLEERTDLMGVFGCYADSGCSEERPVSRFRNLLHRYVHRCGAGPAGSFWAGLGAMRRKTFVDHGGFDGRLDGIEDVELGARVCRSGGKLWLDPSFEGHHLKRWTVHSMIYTDTWVRAAPWTYYGWRGMTPRRGLNLSPAHALAPLILLLSLIFWRPGLVLYLLANLPTYRFFAQVAGPRMGLYSVAFLMIHHLCCLLGAGLGTLRYLAWRTSFHW